MGPNLKCPLHSKENKRRLGMNEMKKSEFRQVKARASIELVEYSDGTVECVPKFEPPIDLTLDSHAMISAMYQDMNNFLNTSNSGDKDENSNEPSNTE